MRISTWLCAALLTGCGGREEQGADAGQDAGRDAAFDAPSDAFDLDAPPLDASSLDCGAIVQPSPLADAKYCPYQADGGTTCALYDYCCEPADGGASCGLCDKSDFVLKCSGMNNGCVDGLCCIEPTIQRHDGSCPFYESTAATGTLCGGGTGTTLYCPTGTAQICSTSAECANGGSCAPLVVTTNGLYPIWLGVCVASDGSVYYAP